MVSVGKEYMQTLLVYIYYRFIVRFPIGLDFLFITFTILLHLLLSWTSSLLLLLLFATARSVVKSVKVPVVEVV